MKTPRLKFESVDVSGPEWHIAYDSQDIEAVLEIEFGRKAKTVQREMDGVTAVAVVIGDGYYEKVAVTGSSRPYLMSAEWFLVTWEQKP